MKLTITPQMAKDWLEKSDPNYRPLDVNRITQYCRSMREGKWSYTGESIKLNCDGSVVDGQHRLHAVVQTGISIVSEVIEGIVDIDDIDTGKPRKLSDVLRVKGYVNVNVLAASLARLYEYSENRSADNVHATGVSVLLQFLKQCPSITSSVAFIEKHRNKHLFLRGAYAVVTHYCTQRSDKELSTQFFTELITGDNLSSTDATYVLREYLIKSCALSSFRRPDATQKLAVCVKAWNSYSLDKPVSNLSFRRTGVVKEKFPRFVGFEKFTPE